MIKNHDELHEECGVVAIWGDDNAAQLTYYGLHSLQHRGQEAAGIVVRNKSRKLNIHKGEGLVSEVFNKEKLKNYQVMQLLDMSAIQLQVGEES
jgi:purF: amidophosphoribosyltransferase